MANKQISDLPSKNTLAGTDVFAVDSNGFTYKITGSAIAAGLKKHMTSLPTPIRIRWPW